MLLQTTRRKVLIREREDLSPPGRRAWLPAGVLEYKLLFRAAACATPRGIPQAWAMAAGRPGCGRWRSRTKNVRKWENGYKQYVKKGGGGVFAVRVPPASGLSAQRGPPCSFKSLSQSVSMYSPHMHRMHVRPQNRSVLPTSLRRSFSFFSQEKKPTSMQITAVAEPHFPRSPNP